MHYVLRRQEEGEEPMTMGRGEVLLELSEIASRQGQEDRAKEVLESALEAATVSDFEQERLARSAHLFPKQRVFGQLVADR